MKPEGLSALIITRGRPGMLRECLAAAAAAGGAEILVGINGEDAASLRTAESFAPAVRTVQLPRLCRGEARNELARRASGRWLCFLDDDTVPPPGYFDRLKALIRAFPESSVFGGGQLLSPAAGPFETAVYALLSSRWGAGPFLERFAPAGAARRAGPEKFILCNLAVDGEFLREKGLAFEGHLSSAEENLLLNRMAAAGAVMTLSGDLDLVHRRRTDMPAFVRQIFSCARGRAQITALSPRGFCAFTLLPPAALLLGAAAAAFSPGLLAAAGAAYAACCAAAAALSAAPAGLKPAVAALFPALHCSYAAGWLWGAAEAAAERLVSGRRPARCRCEENP